MSENKRLDHENKVLKAAEAQRVKNKNELDLATSKLHSMMEEQKILNKMLQNFWCTNTMVQPLLRTKNC